MQPQIVFSDLDGTFVATDKSIPQAHWDLLDELYDRGIPFVPCTGRNLVGIDEHLLAHKAVKYVVVANGAAIYEGSEKQLIHSEPLGWERAVALYEQVKDRDVTFDVFADGKVYAERERYEKLPTFDIDPHNLALVQRIRTPLDCTVPEMQSICKQCDRVTILWKKEEDRDYIQSILDADSTVRWTRSGRCDFEISDINAHKGQALTWLCEHANIPQKASVAFGDSPNDITMLTVAGIGVAMQNASREAIEAADCTTVSNDEDGVAVFVRDMLANGSK